MIRVAICDDDEYIVKRIEYFVSQYGSEKDTIFHTSKFYSGNELINSTEQFDLIFLDVEMNNIDGISAAQKIRRNDMDTPIVFVTNYPNYSMQAHKVHSFDFVSKPFEYDDICRVLTDFMRLGEKRCNAVIELTCYDNNKIIQPVDDIVYVMITNKRELYMYTNGQKEAIILKDNLSGIFSKLDKRQFFIPHRSYIINFKYVRTIKNYYDIVMSNGDIVPLSQRKCEEFRKQQHKYIMGKGVF